MHLARAQGAVLASIPISLGHPIVWLVQDPLNQCGPTRLAHSLWKNAFAELAISAKYEVLMILAHYVLQGQ